MLPIGAKAAHKMKLSISVNFNNIKRTNFSYEHCFGNIHVTRKKLPKPTCVRKIRTFNVDEIDGGSLILLN